MSVLKSVNPSTLETSGSVTTIDPAEIPDIVKRSKAAQEKWACVPPKERAALVKRLRILMSDEAERIARTVYDDTGKPRAECYNTELMTSLASALYHEKLLKKFQFRKKVNQGPMSLMTKYLKRSSVLEYIPLGVVAIIAPFNFPLAIPFTQTLAAVAAGNSVVLKPSGNTPLTGELIANLFEKAGFPTDLVIAIHGTGVAKALAASPGLGKIILTGSVETGKDVMRSAATNLTPVILELGGKDAMVVFDDANMEKAVDCAVWGSFVNSGQVCVGIRRIYVQESSFDEFLTRMVEKTSALKQGAGWDDSNVSVGPMINEAAVQKMEAVCTKMVSEGGKIIIGGKRPNLKGTFFEPTIVVDVPKNAPSVSEEVFGPVVALFPFSDEKEAICLAESTDYALSGSVWTNDIEKAERVASASRSGTIIINNALYTYGLPATPWGGTGYSGFGITHSEEGFRQMMRIRHVHKDKSFQGDVWWMPYSEEYTELQRDIATSFFGRGDRKIGTARKFLSFRKRR